MVNKGSLRCITVAIPVNHIYHGGYYEKQITISLRLSNEEYSILESNSTNLNMTISQYIRSSINHSLPAETNYRQLIAPVMCRIQIRLAELGMEDDEIVKEINKLCLML